MKLFSTNWVECVCFDIVPLTFKYYNIAPCFNCIQKPTLRPPSSGDHSATVRSTGQRNTTRNSGEERSGNDTCDRNDTCDGTDYNLSMNRFRTESRLQVNFNIHLGIKSTNIQEYK